jgi:predicted DCC family thiol-disulfide oxidoreductase YuxK
VGKNIVKNILLDGGSSLNIMMEELQKWLKLPSRKLALYTLQMVDQTITELVALIKDLKVQFHGILYIATFTIMKNNVLDSNYSMLLAQLWLHNAPITHD